MTFCNSIQSARKVTLINKTTHLNNDDFFIRMLYKDWFRKDLY